MSERARPDAPKTIEPPSAPRDAKEKEILRRGARTIVVAAVIVVACLAMYGSVVRHDFTNWDDPTHVTSNARFLPPTFGSIARYWTERSFFGLYIPVTYSAWTIVGMIAGPSLNPHVFHT